jgi:hypothetical protein
MSEGASLPLRSLRRWLVGRLSFGDSEQVLQQVQGPGTRSEDALWRFVQKQAAQEDAAIATQIEASACLPMPVCEAVGDVYEGEAAEFVMLMDGICVKAQKPTREKEGQPRKRKKQKRHDTDVMLLPRRDGTWEWLCEGVSARWSLVQAAASFLRREWSGHHLSVVAITDGARSIREDLHALFGEGVRVILDWYHLRKRMYEDLASSAHGRAEREAWQEVVLGHLWRGRVQEAIAFLLGVVPRNAKALGELVGYLQKHEQEIIDYQRRQEAGKSIGSGPVEKAVDQVVGMRQKDRGMSWTKAGNRALALLKVAELNARQAPA